MKNNNRPLSPHIGIYKPQITSITSILHRITGVGLSFGVVIFIWFLMSVAGSEECFNSFNAFITSLPGRFIVFFWMLGMSYHLLNGVRHLAWDMGIGFKIEDANKSGIAALISSVVLAFIICIVAY